MKKFLTLVLGVFLLIGCSGNESVSKEEVMKAYVASSNKLAESNVFEIKMDGSLDVPKSSLIPEEMKATLTASGLVDVKTPLMSLEMNIKDEKGTMNEDMKMYLDQNYMYMFAENAWTKQALDSSMKESIIASNSEAKALTVEDAQAQFDEFKDVKYSKATKDGVAGYTIKAKMDLEQLMNLVNKESDKNADLKAQLEQVKGLMQKMDLSYEVFVPEDVNEAMVHSITMNMEIMSAPINIGPLNITIQPSNEKITIPEEAKKAKESSAALPTGF